MSFDGDAAGSYAGPFHVESVRNELPERRIEWHASTPSTMTAAGALARGGCASGTIVGADEQSAGIGRHGHSWHSEPGAGLYVSFVLRLPVEARSLPLLMLALGIATREAIAQESGLAPDLRWPNDVLLPVPAERASARADRGDRKCAGILAQLEGDAVVAGIGINVGHTAFPEEIETLATSLRLSGAPDVSRERLLIALARAIDDACAVLAGPKGPGAIIEMFGHASSYASGRRVRVEQGDAVIEGVTRGLDASGFLIVRQDNGKDATILAGGVRPA